MADAKLKKIKETLGLQVRDIRIKAGFEGKTVAFAELLGITDGYLSRIENGERVPGPEVLDALTKYGGDYQALLRLMFLAKGERPPGELGNEVSKPDPRTEAAGWYPVIGRVPAGTFEALVEAASTDKKPAPIPLKRPIRARWVEAWGESMTGDILTKEGTVRISSGDHLWAELDVRPKNGQVALVSLDGQLTVKLWRVHKDEETGERQLELIPTNPKFRVKTFSEDEGLQIEACLISFVDPKPVRLP